MTRAGKEPAEDLKRRLVAVCQEVGLRVDQVQMLKMPDGGSRLIHVDAAPPGCDDKMPPLSVMALVPVSGEWPETVDIRCTASDPDAVPHGPWMQGRGAVPLGSIIDELQETLAEREQVAAAMARGEQGPFQFAKTVWQAIDLLGSLEGFDPSGE